jgi:hypothetical protein
MSQFLLMMSESAKPRKRSTLSIHNGTSLSMCKLPRILSTKRVLSLQISLVNSKDSVLHIELFDARWKNRKVGELRIRILDVVLVGMTLNGIALFLR